MPVQTISPTPNNARYLTPGIEYLRQLKLVALYRLINVHDHLSGSWCELNNIAYVVYFTHHTIRSRVKSRPFRIGAWTCSRTEIPDQIVNLKFDRFRSFVIVSLHYFCTSSCVHPNEGVGLGHELTSVIGVVIW